VVLYFIRKHWPIIFIFFASILPLYNLLTPGLPVAHDTLEHTARIANFYKSLTEGNLIPRWAGNLNWGYGHPILMFLYPLPSYVASLFHLLGFSYINSLKILFAISFSLSGIFMYFWLRKFLDVYAAIVGSIIYLFTPYRFIDLYVRGAVGEHVAFVFLPLVLFSLLNLAELKNKTKNSKYFFNFVFISFSFSFLILSHNAISLLFIPFVLIYNFYLYLENKSLKKLVIGYLSLAYGFLLSFFFWFPAFIEGKYTLRDIVTQNAYADRFVEFKDLIIGKWNYGISGEFTTELGYVQIILIIFGIIILFNIRKTKNYKKYLLLFTLIYFSVSVFLMLTESNTIWEKVTTLQKLQFPWRFLSITTFCSALIGAIVIDKLKLKTIFSIIIIILIIAPTINFWRAKDYKIYTDSYFDKSYPSTTDTGESSPIWSVRSMDNYPKNYIEILSGSAQIKVISRNSTSHEYLVDAKDEVRIKENTLYFPGWKIYNNYIELNNVEFQDQKNRGIMTFTLAPGIHNVILKFEDTKIRKFSNFVSLLSVLLILAIALLLAYSRQRKIFTT
jgi:uncharacterized membrane protein